ncbi:MAG: O-antigen ligase family protein [Hyphomicrobiaceae bacterium]|nr:O-antigen ligase family protein [Hyphomicrobiaceae bacterium]
MHIDGILSVGRGVFRINAGALGALIVAAAMASSSIVFSEPAIADALMLAAIAGLPLLGLLRIGHVTLFNVALWCVVVAAGIAGTTMSVTFDTAIKHQIVTLYLVLGSFVLAGYVAADPEPRARLVLNFYVVACVIATLAAIAGYFALLPGAFELFTTYGRGRGTFKDPNVYGAAVAPALGYLVWIMLREGRERAIVAAAIAAVLAIGLLVSFSRGAWISAALSVAIVVVIGATRARRSSDSNRFAAFATVGTLGFIAVMLGALQIDKVETLLAERASMEQSYDIGPEGRFGGQRKAVALILENPLGIGTHSFRDRHHPEEPHNVYLSMFLNAGWIGGLFYILSVGVTLAVGLHHSLRLGALQGAFVVATAGFAGVAFEGIIIDTDHWRHVFIFMALIWGLSDARRPLIDAARRRTD